ncbi:hypothetical protein IP70_22305, partial [alpha proteobacterium AAP38]
MATEAWQVVTIGGGELYVDMLNVVASFVGTTSSVNSFKSFLALTVMVGFFGLLIRTAFGGTFKAMMEWVVFVTVAINALLLVPARVQVVDRINSTLPGAVVDNVPIGLAVIVSLTTTVGDWATREMEALTSLPNDLTYAKNGMLFGSRLMEEVTKVEIVNSEFGGNVSSYMKQCVLYDLLNGHIPIDSMSQSDDLWNFLTVTYSPNPALSMDYTSGTTKEIVACTEGRDRLNLVWPTQVTSGVNMLARRLFPNRDATTAQSLLVSALPVAHEYLVGVSKTASQAVKQSMMINVIDAAMREASAEAGSTAALTAYVDARTDLSTLRAQQAGGRAATKWLPLLKLTLEAAFVGIFVLSFPLAMVSKEGGVKLGISYLQGFVWVASFGPIYAIVHRVATSDARSDSLIAALTAAGGQGLTLATASGIRGVHAEIAASGAYMYLAVPVLAAAVAGGLMAATSVAQTALFAPQRAAQAAGEETATGNVSLGNNSTDNYSYGNASFHQVATDGSLRAGGFSIEGGSGQTTRIGDSGRVITDNTGATSNLGTGLELGRNLGRELSRRGSQEVSAGDQLSTRSAESKIGSFNDVIDYASTQSTSAAASTALRETLSANEVQALESVKQGADRFAKDNNLSSAVAASVLAQAAVEGETPGLGFIPKVKGSVGGSLNTQGVDSETYAKAKEFVQQTGYRRSLDVATNAMREKSSDFRDGNEKNLGHRLSSDYGEQKRLDTEAQAHYTRAKQYQTAATDTDLQSAAIHQNLSQPFIEWAREQTNPWTGTAYGTTADGLTTSARPEDQAIVRSLADRYIQERAATYLDQNPAPSMFEPTKGDYQDEAARLATAAPTGGLAGAAVLSSASSQGLTPDRQIGSVTNVDAKIAAAEQGVGAGAAAVEDMGQRRKGDVLLKQQEDGAMGAAGDALLRLGGNITAGVKDLAKTALDGGDDRPLDQKITSKAAEIEMLAESGEHPAELQAARRDMAGLEGERTAELEWYDKSIEGKDRAIASLSETSGGAHWALPNMQGGRDAVAKDREKLAAAPTAQSNPVLASGPGELAGTRPFGPAAPPQGQPVPDAAPANAGTAQPQAMPVAGATTAMDPVGTTPVPGPAAPPQGQPVPVAAPDSAGGTRSHTMLATGATTAMDPVGTTPVPGPAAPPQGQPVPDAAPDSAGGTRSHTMLATGANTALDPVGTTPVPGPAATPQGQPVPDAAPADAGGTRSHAMLATGANTALDPVGTTPSL